jgi:hypothetical protein
MVNSIHIANSKGRDATVGLATVKAEPSPKLGVPGVKVAFRRYIAASERGIDEAIKTKLGVDYAAALVKGDPEVDPELVGRTIDQTQTVYLDGKGSLMFADPKFLEVVTNPDGSEKERRDPVDTESNVDAEVPVRWTGKKIPLTDAIRRFVFRRTLQLQHIDGLTYDYLYEMARELEEGAVLMLVGSGEKGSGPLIFQANGRAYRGFLEGRTKGKSYRLVLHLSDMELKAPAARPPGKEEA